VKVLSKPTADFLADAVCINTPTEFVDKSIINSNDSIREWWWFFGDEHQSNLQSPIHQYDSVRTYNVMLIISSKVGCWDTISVPVTVHAKPIALVSTTQPSCGSTCETFTDLSNSVEGTITGSLWNFLGGNPASSSERNPKVCYSAKGIYPLTLITTNSFGCSDTLHSSEQTKVFPLPGADFYVTEDPDNTLNPRLSLNHNWSNDVVKWYWDFGDQSPVDSVHKDPTHIYKNVLMNNNFYNFNLNLKVQNQFGCIARISREINIKPSFTFYIPNTFTPNGFSNDKFFGKGKGISEYKISIFDRWGEMIYECESHGNSNEWDADNGDGMPSACKWDGNYQGHIVQNDVYVWKVELKNILGETYKYFGNVNVVK
jgi:gliding motility-associated-like protein